MRLRFAGAIFLAGMFLLTGCSARPTDQNAGEPPTGNSDAEVASNPETDTSGAPIEPPVAVTIAQMQEELKSHSGKVVVLDLWALW